MDQSIFKEIKFISEKDGLLYKDIRYLLIKSEALADMESLGSEILTYSAGMS